MVKVKSDAEIKRNYEQSTALVPQRFESGVKSAAWQRAAIDGQDLYEQQMARTEILKRREAGINKVSDADWQRATIEKGAKVIGARMKAASQKQVDGYRPYKQALEALDLEPRTSDPMQNLINRAGAVMMAQVNKKKELMGE